MSKENLTQIDIENWSFTLYETADGKWIGEFVYSPYSYIDWNMLIELTDLEKTIAQNNRQYLIDLSEAIKNNYKNYLHRALDRNNYHFNS